MTPAKMIEELVNHKLISDKELKDLVIAAIHLFQSNKHLFAIEKTLKEICEYERALP